MALAAIMTIVIITVSIAIFASGTAVRIAIDNSKREFCVPVVDNFKKLKQMLDSLNRLKEDVKTRIRKIENSGGKVNREAKDWVTEVESIIEVIQFPGDCLPRVSLRFLDTFNEDVREGIEQVKKLYQQGTLHGGIVTVQPSGRIVTDQPSGGIVTDQPSGGIVTDQPSTMERVVKWPDVLSADAFLAFEAAGLDYSKAVKETGWKFQETILARGGGKHH
ncbi:hypothetical protein SLEP1_g48317 [Rubroshorea leprosula]|uniref:Uncharacterized protein n=1 Tax=Rubroshorea leprosula TaxID=152421 RepID=A0AAV5LU41_9ROSI|nr:hypothetical protein SLEP1_g48317 [Rubroshorea leprosula]